jgi:hypothetical protein
MTSAWDVKRQSYLKTPHLGGEVLLQSALKRRLGSFDLYQTLLTDDQAIWPTTSPGYATHVHL